MLFHCIKGLLIKCWQAEFYQHSTTSLVDDHFLYSRDFDSGVVLWGDIKCWSPLGIEGLTLSLHLFVPFHVIKIFRFSTWCHLEYKQDLLTSHTFEHIASAKRERAESSERKLTSERLVSLAEFHIKRSHFGDNFCNRCQSNCQNTFRSSWNRLQWFSNGGVNYTNLNFYSGCCTGQHLPKMWQIGRKSGVTEKAVFRETGDQNL